MFNTKKTYQPEELVTVIVANSQTLSIGQLVTYRTGFATIDSTAASAIGGVIVDFVDANGNSVFGSLAALGSATVSGSPSSGTLVAGGSNQTVDLISARIETSKKVIFSADVTGTINTTNTSATQGGWANPTTGALTVDETTHTRTITTLRTLKGWGTDPEDSTRLLVSISSSELWDAQGALA